MQEEKRNSIIPRIAMGLIFVLMAVYAIHHITSIFGEDITTIAAGVSTERTNVSGSGYVFRNETPLYSANGGLVDYIVSNGEKVGRGQQVASVYESMYTSSGRRMVALIDERIALLEASLAYSETDMTELRRSVENKYYSIMKKLADGEVASVADEAETMLMEMNAIRSLIDGDDSAVKQSLSELYTLRTEMFNAAGASVTESVEVSGYFYAYADGYESVFTANAASEADGDQLYALISGGVEAQGVSDNCYGKMSDSSEWLFVLPISAEESVYFEEGITYSADVLSDGTSLPMTLVRKLEVSAAENTALLVFSCNRLPADGGLDRCFGISIEVDSVSGIYVPKGAIEYLDGQRGVYILKGSVVHFRAVEVIYIGNDYYLVSEKVENEASNYAYLSSNELIIVNGQNMFEGRILD